MIRDDQHWFDLTDRFYAAAVDGTGWYEALDGLARATGSRSGELIGISRGGILPFNLMTNVDSGLHPAFVAGGGGDPAVNPRVAAGMGAPILKTLADYDFLTPDEHRRNPHYQEFARPWDIPFICLTTLERTPELLIGLAVLRSEREGHIDAGGRAAFAAVAPHVRGAVRMQMSLEGRGQALVTGALDALSMPVFVCDHTGRVRSLTPSAEALVREPGGLRLAGGRLGAARRADAQVLQDAIDAATLHDPPPGAPLLRTVVLRAPAADARPLVLDVVRMPAGPYALAFRPQVLVVARGGRPAAEARAPILRAAFGLTPAETQIALLLADGLDSAAIAARRRSSVGTVRVQIKRVLAKLHVKSQIELAARLRDV
jgi:DNA-binding CsgD family transcriptional regulator